MSATLIGLVCGLVFFAAFVLIHVAVLAFSASRSPSKSMVLSFTAAAIGAVAMAAVLVPIQASQIVLAEIYALMTMACLLILYAPFFFTIYTSLSVQSILMTAARGGEISVETLYGRFASHDLTAGRLTTMVASGYLVETGGRYHLTGKGRRIAICFRALKRLWRLGLGG